MAPVSSRGTSRRRLPSIPRRRPCSSTAISEIRVFTNSFLTRRCPDWRITLNIRRSPYPRSSTRMFKVIRQSGQRRSEEHTSELQSRQYLVCRLLLEKKKKQQNI